MSKGHVRVIFFFFVHLLVVESFSSDLKLTMCNISTCDLKNYRRFTESAVMVMIFAVAIYYFLYLNKDSSIGVNPNISVINFATLSDFQKQSLRNIICENADMLWGTSADSKAKTENIIDIIQTEKKYETIYYHDNNNTKGFLTIYLDHPCIYFLAIAKETQGKGYGGILLNAGIERLRNLFPNQEITLNVQKRNVAAQQFYKKNGFDFNSNYVPVVNETSMALIKMYLPAVKVIK